MTFDPLSPPLVLTDAPAFKTNLSKWEYKVLSIPYENGWDRALNEHGSEGWELVNFHTSGGYNVLLIFKRQV